MSFFLQNFPYSFLTFLFIVLILSPILLTSACLWVTVLSRSWVDLCLFLSSWGYFFIFTTKLLEAFLFAYVSWFILFRRSQVALLFLFLHWDFCICFQYVLCSFIWGSSPSLAYAWGFSPPETSRFLPGPGTPMGDVFGSSSVLSLPWWIVFFFFLFFFFFPRDRILL